MDIKAKVKSCGWTMDRLAAEMTNKKGEKGTSQSAVSQLINGNPSLDKLVEIASIIGISVSELVADEEPNTNTIKCPKCGAELTLKENVPTD